MADEKYFIYYKDITHYDFVLYNTKEKAEENAKEILENDDKKVGTVWIGQLVAVARRQVIFDKD